MRDGRTLASTRKIDWVITAAPIETSRLRLVTLTDVALEKLCKGDVAGASQDQGFAFSEDFLATVNDVFLTIHLEGLRRWPSAAGWFARGIVRKDDDGFIGHCGFHGTPQDVGRAEIGYTIFPPDRGRGYATEAAGGLLAWARSQGESSVFAAVSPTNAPSIAVVTRLGFSRVGVQATASGEEHVFEARLSDVTETPSNPALS